ncbi:MAG: PAS domain-containing sensor histidine kinase [Anaerolineae bacterium]
MKDDRAQETGEEAGSPASQLDVDSLLNAIPVGVIALNQALDIIHFNPAARAIANLTQSDLGRSLAHLVDALGCPDLIADTAGVLGTSQSAEHELEAPDGHWYSVQIRPCRSQDSDPEGVVLTLTDITHEKEVRSELRSHEDQLDQLTAELERHTQGECYRALLENSPDLIASFDRHMRHLYINPAVERMTGLSPEAYIGKTNAELGYAPELVAFWDQEIRRVFDTGKTNTLEFSFTDTDGHRHHLHSLLVPEISEAGEAISVTSVVRDLTAFEETAAALKASNVKYRTLFNGARNPIVIFDRDVNFVLINRAAAEVFGRDVEDITGKSLQDITPEYFDVLKDRISRVLATGEAVQSLDSPTLPDGEKWYLTITQPIENVPDWGEAVQVIAYDMTKRVKAAEALKESRAQLQHILENLPAGVVHRVGDRLWINKAVEGITGYTQGEVGAPDDWLQKLYGKSAAHRKAKHVSHGEAGLPKPVTLQITHKDGNHRWVQFSGFTLENNGEISVLHDITAQREATDALEAALQEKETLLRELYHRTKNNMQVISAILALQSIQIEDPNALIAIEETQTRIRSIALVHEKLYESENLSSIDLDVYITDLVDLLTRTYEAHAKDVTLRLDLERVPVVIDVAIPCGLILNELISNALKHGFPDKRAGEIHITLALMNNDEILLTVSDNGVGAPTGFDFRGSSTLGLQTVLGVAEHQLQGTVSFTSYPDKGVTCRVRFPHDVYRPRV